jgi:hypothetical protein
MKCRCGSEIPERRVNLGYTECVNCSKVEQVGCIDIVYHKTGNTIQITDKETAEKMRQLSRRTGFGTLRGMKPGPKSDTYNPKGKIRGSNLMARAVFPDPKRFEEAGAVAWDILEREGFDAAMKWLQKKIDELWLTPVQVGKIRAILSVMQPKEPEPTPEKPKWYSKLEPKQPKPEVDEDISDIFKYWKR